MADYTKNLQLEKIEPGTKPYYEKEWANLDKIDANNPKHNFTATTDPTATDNDSAGYSIGSIWINTSTKTIFQCTGTDATTGAAVWNEVAKIDLSNVSDATILNKVKNVDGSGSGLDADLLDGIDSSQFQRNDTADLDIGTYTSFGNGAKRVVKYLGMITDTKPGLVLFAKKYNGTDKLPKQGFIGKVILSRGNTSSYNISEEYNVVCASAYAYASTKLFISGNYSNAYLVEVTYNSEQWYGFYSPATSTRAVWIDGFLYTTQDPIFITDASSYTVTKVNGNDLYVNQNKVWTAGNDGSGSGLDADMTDGFHASQSPTVNQIPVLDSSKQLNLPFAPPNIKVAGQDYMCRTFYVDAVNGDDNNDGSQANPFKTIEQACNSVPTSGLGVINLLSDVSLLDIVNLSTKVIDIHLNGHSLSLTVDSTSLLHRFWSNDSCSLIICGDSNSNSKLILPSSSDGDGSQKTSHPSLLAGGGLGTGFRSLALTYGVNVVLNDTAYKLLELNNNIAGSFTVNGSITDNTGNNQTWQDLVTGIVKDSNGIPRNIVSNIIF